MRTFALVRLAALVTPAAALATVFYGYGCGIDVVGVAPASSVAGAREDAGGLFAPAGAGAAACACAVKAPEGWTLVAYGDRTATCAGDLETLDLVTEPDGSGACVCGCTTTPPPCTVATWGTKVDNSGTATCDSTSSVTHAVTTACVTTTGNLGQHGQVIGPTASGATCAAAAQKDVAAVKSKAVRICEQRGATCACNAGPGLTTCVAANGERDCPAAFPTKHLVAASVDVSCGACTCTVTQSSCKASVTWFSDTNCGTAIATIDSDSCKTQGGGTYSSFKYEVEPAATCKADPAPAGTAALVAANTVCCP